ncbi:MAG: M1 family metallopeptidase [Bacteroidales bacterium]|jgi:hypothetical protein|nr:M1 family metallopeptidase [Bacteroidales bacterium]
MKFILKITIASFLFFISTISFSQSYFQQEVNNTINVTLDDVHKNLTGNIKIEYINNSPYQLEYIYIHLWPNAYKNKETKFAQQQLQVLHSKSMLLKKYRNGYIDSLDFQVNGIQAELSYIQADIGILDLPFPLNPGDTVYIYTDFFVKIPTMIDRFGYDENFYSITQWFPKPAVFDKDGWHPISYLSIGEFYSEFGSYDVSITLRDDFIVAATGNLKTNEEINRLDKYIRKCTDTKNKTNIPPFGNPKKTKTIRFYEENIHDFAWFASPDFIVNKDTIKPGNSEHSINCWTFYDRKFDNLWNNSVEYVKKAILFFSENIGVYPYNNCSAVSHPKIYGGGMEYPGITIVNNDSEIDLERIIAHEIAHNWFYGILASNERKDAWIDEGFTSFYENKYFDHFYPEMTFGKMVLKKNMRLFGWNKLPPRFEMELTCNYLMHENIAQKPSLNSEEMSSLNYFSMSYYKPALGIYTLEEFLGEEDFKHLIKEFYNTYQFKHIYPETIETFFTDNTEKNINWFFNDIINSTKRIDYKIKGLRNDSILIKNKGKTEVPLFLHIGDSLIISDSFKGSKKFPLNGQTEIIIDKNFKTLDYNRSNNSYSKGFFKKSKPVKISIANVIDNPLITEFPVFPAMGYNYTDGFMLGIMFYSPPVPKRKFDYQLIPMWAFGSDKITGVGNISLFFHPLKTPIREIEIFTSGRRFSINTSDSGTYYKIASGIRIKLKTDLSGQYISEFLIRNINATDYIGGGQKNFQQLNYKYANLRKYNPYSYSFNIERGKGFIKSSIEAEAKINYNYKNKGLKIRLFAGKFLYNSSGYNGNYNFRMSGNLGIQDYFYDHLFLGRNEDIRINPGNFLAHQFIRNEGGFAMYTPWGQTNNWLAAINFDSNSPIKTIDVFLNIGVCPDADKIKWYYEFGIKISLLKDFINIYFPVTATKDIWNTSNDIYTKNYIQKIRFTISLEKLNLLYYRDKPFLLF